MSTHRITIVGCGSWGARVAKKLHQRGDVHLLCIDRDVQRARDLSSSVDGEYAVEIPVDDWSDSVVIATPPHAHIDAVHEMLDRRLMPKRVRIEKPLAASVADAEIITRECAENGVTLSCGFTMMYSDLYRHAAQLVHDRGVYVHHIEANRIGRAPKNHHADPVLDLGPHAACFAAQHYATIELNVEYCTHRKRRTATWHLSDGSELRINELAGGIATNNYSAYLFKNDALEDDLDAWLADTHIGTPALALETQQILERINA